MDAPAGLTAEAAPTPAPMGGCPVLNLQMLGGVTLASLRESVLTVSGAGQRGCPICRGRWGHSHMGHWWPWLSL